MHFSRQWRFDSQKWRMTKWSLYRGGVAQWVGRGIALLLHDRGTRSGWVVSSTPRPHFTPGKDPVPILQEAGWVPGTVWTGAENLVPTGIRSRTVQPVAQSLYRLSYPVDEWQSRAMNLKCDVFGRGDSYLIRKLSYVMSARHFWKLRHNFDNQSNRVLGSIIWSNQIDFLSYTYIPSRCDC